MKNLEIKNKNILKLGVLGIALIVTVFSSCLKLQQKKPYSPETPVLANFKDQTAWDWVQTHPQGDFIYMEQAINITGLQNLYSQVDSQRTYLLLKDVAFTQNSGILQIITGSTSGNLTTLTAPNIQRLKNLLMYHIVNQYVDQGPDNLKVLFKDYFFQTLLPGPSGIISIRRDETFNMIFNQSPLLPGTKKGTYRGNTLFNYVMKNGVSHLLSTYIRVVAF